MNKWLIVCTMYVCVCVCELHQLCPTLCDPMDCSPPGSSVHGILQTRILEWSPPPEDLLNPGIKPMSLASALAAHIQQYFSVYQYLT